jgi:hypothetical protein
MTAILLKQSEIAGIRLKCEHSGVGVGFLPPTDTHTHVGSTIDDEGMIIICLESIDLLSEKHIVKMSERLPVNDVEAPATDVGRGCLDRRHLPQSCEFRFLCYARGFPPALNGLTENP